MEKNMRNNKISLLAKRFIKHHLFILLSFVFCSQLSAQTNITGKVSSGDSALADVSVILKGTSQGTRTDANGEFSINAPANGILVFSHSGFSSSELKIKGRSTINVTLTSVAITLGEVVVVGYGTRKKVSLTGALSTIGGNELQDRSVTNISNALNGLAPGLSVETSTGVPGQSSDILIRGLGTFNNSSPLYVIDGIIRDQNAMDALDLHSISSISILKDAASAAVYGSRAGNGVILISTKQGTNHVPEFTFNTSYGIQSPTVNTKMMTAYQSGLFINDLTYNMKNYDLAAAKLDPRYVTEPELEYLKTHTYSWLDYIWKKPTDLQSNLSITGGSEKIKYFMNLGGVDNKGGLPGFDFKRYNFQGNTTVLINKNLTATVNLSGYVGETDFTTFRFADGGDLADTYSNLRFWGGPWMPPYINGTPTWGGAGNIIETIIHGGYNKTKNTSMSGLLSLNYSIPAIEGLSLKGTFSYNYDQNLNKKFFVPTTSYIFKGSGEHGYIYDANSTITGKTVWSPFSSSFVSEGYSANTYQQSDLQLNYSRTFGKHSIDGTIVFEQSSSQYQSFGGQKNDLLTTAIDQLFVGSAEPSQSSFNGTTSKANRLSYVGRLNYNYNEKYLLDASFREDGSYIFAPGYQWGFFPSISAGWRISQESFFKDRIKFVDNLKIRASFGLLGNDAVSPYQWQSSYTTSNGPFFTTPSTAINYGVFPNPKITWEKTQMTNVGLDAGFLSNSLDFSIDYFRRYTYDMLFSRTGTIPGTFGISLPKENYGKVQNNGFEVSLGYKGHVNKVSYYVRGNLGYAKDKVKYIDVAANAPAYLNPIGKRLHTIRGYVADDMFRTTADFNTKLPLQGYEPALGMMAYKDLYGPDGKGPDSIVNGNDQVIISQNADPLYNFGFSLGAKWKQFSIDILLQGLAGWDKVLGPTFGQSNGGTEAFWNDHWSPTNPNGKYPRAWLIDPTSYLVSTFWLKNASFLRLKNVNISYEVPLNSKRSGIKNIRIYVSGNNLLLLYSKMKVIDPELNNIRSYPIMREITGGLAITF